MTDKEIKLDEVEAAAETYRLARRAVFLARENFIDAIMQARAAKVTQQSIAERSVIDPYGTKPMSRQRVTQFIEERKQ